MFTRSLLVVAMVTLCSGCGKSAARTGPALTYPYLAPAERAQQIRTGRLALVVGSSPEAVKKAVGEPDEVRDLFDKIKSAKPVGYTWWYIVERRAASGSAADRAEKLVRVSFGLDDRVTKVDAWGLD